MKFYLLLDFILQQLIGDTTSSNRIMNAFNQYRYSKPGLKEIDKILNSKKLERKKINQEQINKFDKLVFEKVNFSYNNLQPVLKSLDLEILKGIKFLSLEKQEVVNQPF